MAEILGSLILFVVGIIAGVINVTAGGGSSLTLPALIFLGMDPTAANGTNRIGILFQNISASASFRKEKVIQTKSSLIYALLTIPGAILGAIVAVRIDDTWFKKILAVVLIVVVITTLFPKSKNKIYEQKERKFGWLIYPALFAVGFYGGFIQVGTGLLIIALLYNILNIDLVTVNMHKVFIVLIYTIPALLIFLISGNVNWILGLSLAAGTALGGWWAAKFSVRKGEKFIRYFLVLALIVIALKLLGLV